MNGFTETMQRLQQQVQPLEQRLPSLQNLVPVQLPAAMVKAKMGQ